MKNKHSHFRKTILLLSLVLGLVLAIVVVLYAMQRYSSINNDNVSVSDKALRDQTSSVKQFQNSDQAQNPDQLESQSLHPSADVTENSVIDSPVTKSPVTEIPVIEDPVIENPVVERKLSFQDHLAIQAELRLQSDVTYDGSYHKIAYPLGDVPAHIGVCTDVVIRSFRGLGIDLQKRVHEDMKRNFRSYPKKWRLTKPDTNIDHRRVLNLMAFFKRSGASLKITDNPLDYFAGNVVAWDLSKGKGAGKGKALMHIGIVSNYVSEFTSNPLIVHNIGAGPQMNDMLFDYKIIGHYKYGDIKTAQK